jgi:gp16 family phage-associated protein
MPTSADIRNLFRANGISVSAWARARGFSPALVYRVLRGDASCCRGKTHEIAVALGLKALPTAVELSQFERICPELASGAIGIRENTHPPEDSVTPSKAEEDAM